MEDIIIKGSDIAALTSLGDLLFKCLCVCFMVVSIAIIIVMAIVGIKEMKRAIHERNSKDNKSYEVGNVGSSN